VTTAAMQNWLEKLGYAAEPAVLHRRGEEVPETHPYALEIKTLLKPDGAIRAQAVFDVEGVPPSCLSATRTSRSPLSPWT